MDNVDREKLIQAKNLIEAVLTSKGESSSPVTVKGSKSEAKTLGSHIIEIRETGYFSEPRTAREVHSAIQKVYACEIKRVENELARLQKKGEFRKTSKVINEKKLIAYVK